MPDSSRLESSNFDLECRDQPAPDTEATKKDCQLLPYGSKCEVISLDARANRKGDYELKPSTAPLETDAQDGGEWAEYALTLIRYFDQKGKLDSKRLKVKSPHMLKALKSVTSYYPGAPVITEKKVNYKSPFHLLTHCLEDLRGYRNNSDDDDVKLHINLLIRVVEVEMSEELDELKALLPAGKITFPLAWAIFRPGTMTLTHKKGAPEKYRTHSTEYIKVGLKFTGQQIDYDGSNFKVKSKDFLIPPFFGVIDITSLPIYPLDFDPEAATTKQFLIDRGHRWFKLQNVTPKMMTCDGICITDGDDEDRLKGLTTFGRMVIDNAMYGIVKEREKKPDTLYKAAIEILSKVRDESDDDESDSKKVTIEDLVKVGSNGELSDDDAALCTPFVRGYSLSKRLWGSFDVNKTKEIEWSPNAFEKLILRKESKDAIMALVQAYIGTPTAGITQDLVQGKGLGMIFLLHGPPGVGKTLTAETIAEHLKRPLYFVSGGELGTSPVEVESKLSKILEIATAWKAVVLIDEADVFLQQRDLNNLERNSLVSIFLRQLEYYEGLMFLTTNRANCIDEAFRSRIDVALYYPDLSETMRSRLWESSLQSLDPNTLDIDLETAIPELAKEEMNGREIRKVIKAARLMASYYDKKLNLEHLHALMGFRMVGSLPEMVEEFDKKPSGRPKRQRRLS